MFLDTHAIWIGTPLVGTGLQAPPSPMLRRRFQLAAAPRRAELAITALGLYEPYLNGRRVGDHELAPGWTDYRHRLHVQTFDVTDLLRVGSNTLGAFLGDGWYAGKVAGSGRGVTYGQQPKLRCVLTIEGRDGQATKICSDEDWRWHPGPILSSDLLDGEHYDARKEIPGWCDPSSADQEPESWRSVSRFDDPDPAPRILESAAPPIRVTHEIPAVSVEQVGDTWFGASYLFDFGQNFTGKVRLKVKGPAGATLRLRYAEVLRPDGKGLDRSNLRTCIATDSYTLRGDPDGETWTTRFTFHGFRYVEVQHDMVWLTREDGPRIGALDENSLVGLVLHSDMPRIGSFETGHRLVNRLQQNTVWGLRSNFLDVPTDCPQRDERLGWTGDAQVFAATASFNYNTAGFYRKWLNDVEDSQLGDGGIPSVAPNTLNHFDAGAGWSDVAVVMPWEVYRATGDRGVLERHYGMMKRWAEFQAGSADDGVRGDPDQGVWAGYGDWLALDGGSNDPQKNATPLALVGTAYHAFSQNRFARIARLLGHDQDAQAAEAAAEEARQAFHRRYVKDDRITIQSQTSHLMALAFDLFDEEGRDVVFDDLLGLLAARDHHLSTGFLGTPLWCDVLTRFGRTDLACNLLLNETYPGWLYPVTLGATTMWERWNSWHPEQGFVDVTMNSLNHYAYGAVGDWMYRTLGGIGLDLAEDVGPRLVLRPHADSRLGHCRASLDSAVGLIRSAWKVGEDGAVDYEFEVPEGIFATLELPGQPAEPIAAGTHRASGVLPTVAPV